MSQTDGAFVSQADDRDRSRARVRLLLTRISNEVKLQALMELENGAQSFAALLSAAKTTPQSLSRSMRELEEDGLVIKTTYQESQGFNFALTELGASLCKPLAHIRRWAEEHAGQVVARARELSCQARSDGGPL